MTDQEPTPGAPTQRKEGWHVRSILAEELPATCKYCGVRRPEQARCVISFRILDVYPSGVEVVKSEKAAPACVEHGVYVQQTYILEARL